MRAAKGGGDAGHLDDLRWGIEREAHRVLRDGSLAATSHPTDLRPPRFTRDFAESQLEIVTPPLSRPEAAIASLERLTDEALRAVGRERLWPFSMPPRLPADGSVRIADFGSGPEARRAHLYREGLALRYGLARQMISGVHVNVSLGPRLVSAAQRMAPLTSEERGEGGGSGDALYLRMARHLVHDLPLLVLLFGASPIKGDDAPAPRALSYRNSHAGYSGTEYASYLRLDSVASYVAGIRRAMRTESAAFARLGLVEGGHVHQLNARVLQSDKEFYAPIRLRQSLHPGESNLQALARRGVGYLELRFLDVDPFVVAGLSIEGLRLLHLFLLDSAFRPSLPPSTEDVADTLRAVSEAALWSPSEAGPGTSGPDLTALAHRLDGLGDWAEALDEQQSEHPYGQALGKAQSWLAAPRTLPAVELARRFDDAGTDWTTFGARWAQRLRSRQPVRHRVAERQEVRHELDHAWV